MKTETNTSRQLYDVIWAVRSLGCDVDFNSNLYGKSASIKLCGDKPQISISDKLVTAQKIYVLLHTILEILKQGLIELE